MNISVESNLVYQVLVNQVLVNQVLVNQVLVNHQTMRKETIKKIINLIITVLTAIASAVCVQSCKGL